MTERKTSDPLITKACPQDFEALKALLDRANEYSVQQSGLRLWTVMDHVYSQLYEQIAQGELYIIRDLGGSVIVSIAFNENPGQWGSSRDDGNALYFYKWMKNPDKATHEQAISMLAFAARKAVGRHKSFLRCDTVKDLPELTEYYKKTRLQSRGRI